MLRGYSAILFDLGGTLWDAFGPLGREQVTRDAVFHAASSILGPSAPAEQVDKLSVSILTRWETRRSARADASRVSFASPVFREDDLFEILAEAAAPFGRVVSPDVALVLGDDLTKHDRPYPETVPVLTKIRTERPEVIVGIVSNTVVQGAVIDRYLREQGILALVGFRVLSSELGWRKPHPAIYASALTKAGTRPRDTLFVGDRPLEDIVGPGRAGMRAALRVSPGGANAFPGVADAPSGVAPVAVMEDLRGVLRLLCLDEGL